MELMEKIPFSERVITAFMPVAVLEITIPFISRLFIAGCEAGISTPVRFTVSVFPSWELTTLYALAFAVRSKTTRSLAELCPSRTPVSVGVVFFFTAVWAVFPSVFVLEVTAAASAEV